MIWKDIEGFEGLYQVSDEGQVRSLDRVTVMKNGKTKTIYGRIISQSDNGRGYMFVMLHSNNKYHHKYVHRLVAEAFIPNPDNFPCINHISENRAQNNVENLEWCDYSYNVNYGNRLNKFLTTMVEKGYRIGEDSYQRRLEYMRRYNSSEEIKQRRRDYVAANREEINARMREYRKRRKEEGRPIRRKPKAA